jgi:hypothetical protein
VIPYFEGSNRPRQESYNWVGKHTAELSQMRTDAAAQMFAKHEAEQAAKAEK